MSASHWSICPRCRKAEEDRLGDLRDRAFKGSGTMPVEEFDALRAEVAEGLNLEETPRNGRATTPTGLLFAAAGLGRHLVSRWRRDGVPLDGADRLAVALGEHPCAVWPEWWDVET